MNVRFDACRDPEPPHGYQHVAPESTGSTSGTECYVSEPSGSEYYAGSELLCRIRNNNLDPESDPKIALEKIFSAKCRKHYKT